MFDINEIQKRAQAASQRAAEDMKKSFEKSEEIQRGLQSANAPKTPCTCEEEVQTQIQANTQRQVEIMGQIFGPDTMAQMAVNEEMLQNMVNEKVSQVAAQGVNGLMEQLLGEDMGILAAALETLDMQDEDDEEEPAFEEQLEQRLYVVLEETMSRLENLPEPQPVAYAKDRERWERFGILLSGILSRLNDHSLDGLDVEEHTPVLEQSIVSLVRRSWGIDGRSQLLDMIRYLTQEGYVWRYQLYAQAASPQELLDEEMDQEEQESVCRAWRFAQRYKSQYAPEFLSGWDIGRAAMLTRWGCYLGWITQGEATGILWELSHMAAERLHSWREFAQSYLFGGLMWKMLCADSSAESYLGYLADAATDLLSAKEEAYWRQCPWPEQKRIGFVG